MTFEILAFLKKSNLFFIRELKHWHVCLQENEKTRQKRFFICTWQCEKTFPITSWSTNSCLANVLLELSHYTNKILMNSIFKFYIKNSDKFQNILLGSSYVASEKKSKE